MKVDKRLVEKLGKLFKEKRERSGLSQGKVCRALGYRTPQYLSNFERGISLMPFKKLRLLIEMYRMDSESVVRFVMESQRTFLRKQLLSKRKSKEPRRAFDQTSVIAPTSSN